MESIFLPVSINIAGKRIVIVGGGKVAFHKATALSRFTNCATVISPAFCGGFDSLPFERIEKEYEPDDLRGAFLVYVCTGDETLNSRVKRDAAALGVLASVCDNPALCDFISPAVHKDGYMTIAVSSNAQNTRRSIAVRNRIGEMIESGELKI
jgi:siroheme synthase-like protein